MPKIRGSTEPDTKEPFDGPAAEQPAHHLVGAARVRASERHNRAVISQENKVIVVVARVTGVHPELECADLEAADAVSLSIDDATHGVDWRTLHSGEELRCVVQGTHTTRVLSAERVS